MIKIILASQSKVRKNILEENGISCDVKPSHVDEEPVKESLIKKGETPEVISKNLAELKANKVSGNYPQRIVLGADSVIDLNNNIISKPKNRTEAMEILRKLNDKKHYLISSICVSKNGSMIWNYTDKALLRMKKLSEKELAKYLTKISDENLYLYNVYQIEGEGKNLFSSIEGDENTIMGLPISKLKNYLENLQC